MGLHKSPLNLFQEQLYGNEWLILVSCMFLNRSRRIQVEGIWDNFVSLAPTPDVLLQLERDKIAQCIRSLGFMNRRTAALYKMSNAYLFSSWEHASELPGIGEYAARCWEIFCKDKLGDVPPNDHALLNYWLWCKEEIREGRMEQW